MENEDDRTLELEMFNAYLYVLLVLATVALVSDLVPKGIRLWKWHREYRRRRLCCELMTKLKRFGPLWVVHSIGKVTAVCTFNDFHNALSQWKEEISKGTEPFWGTPTIPVPQTFTFTGKDTEMSAATGTEGDMNDILIALIYRLLGDKRFTESLIRRYIDDFGKAIVKRDDRLFVPFIGNKWNPEWEPYRHMRMSEARTRLFQVVLDSVGQ